MRSLAYAIRTLTRLAVGSGALEKEEQSLFWFPLVGALYGAAAVLIALLPLPEAVIAALIIASWAYLNRAFHLDGLADLADGLGGGWNAERSLTIMRDSHIGAFGTIALIIALLMQYAALSSLTSDPLALLIAPLFGRAMIVVAAGLLPYAREGEGSASKLVRGAKIHHVIVVGVQLLLIALLCWFIVGLPGMQRVALSLAFAIVFTGLVLRVAKKRLGGVTGDVLGAVAVIAESAALVGFLIPLA